MDIKPSLFNLKSLKKVHIIGVGGTLMGAFAAFLRREGVEVTGSDQNIYPPMSDVLKNSGVDIFNGYHPENLISQAQRPDLVVIGNVIRADNEEAKAAIGRGYRYSSLPEAMEQLLLKETRNLVIAGTHGKTTTSSLLAYVLVCCGQNPSYFIGGVSQDLPLSFHVNSSQVHNSRYFVLEGDEYDTAFWDKVPKFNHYLPDEVILTSIEYDHADIYPDFQSVLKAFEGLVTRIRPQGKMIACFDYPVIQELVKNAKISVYSYGSSDSNARFTPGRMSFETGLTQFEVLDRQKKVDEVTLSLPGHHNVLNALAVWIQCQELGLDAQSVRSALKSFQGVKRRQEVRGEVQGVLVIDDFAHHPTAVRETLKALRYRYPQRRLIAVFEPRSATSRRKVFQKQYSEAFQEADQVYVAQPYDQSRILEEEKFSTEELIDDLKKAGKESFLISSAEEGVALISKQLRSGDLVAVLSNGSFDGFITKLLDHLK